MNFATLLDTLRHTESGYEQFHIGSYVKTKHPESFNPILDADERPIRIITAFIKVDDPDNVGQELEGAVTMVDTTGDDIPVANTESVALDDLEIYTSDNISYPDYISYLNSYWLVVGREASLLKSLKLSDFDYNIEMKLISDMLVEELSKADMEIISNINLTTMLVPLNLTIRPLLALKIATDDNNTIISRSANNVKRIYAQLTPVNSTQNNVQWSITSSNSDIVTLAVDNNDSRICDATFTANGIVTIQAKSIDIPDISYTETFTITD